MEALTATLDAVLRSPYSSGVAGLAVAAVGLSVVASAKRGRPGGDAAPPSPAPSPLAPAPGPSSRRSARTLSPAPADRRAGLEPELGPQRLAFSPAASPAVAGAHHQQHQHHHHQHDSNATVYVTGDAAVRAAAELLSDTVFVYSLQSEQQKDQQQRSGGEAAKNLYRQAVVVKEIDTRAGAGSVVLGALAGGMQHVSVVAPSSALPHMIPALHQLARRGAPVVLHVAAADIGADLAVTPDMGDVMATRHTGLALLLSFDGQESQDMALVAHHSRLPVLHAYDALHTGQTEAAVRVLDRHQLARLFATSAAGSAAEAEAEATAAHEAQAAVRRLDASMGALAGVLGRRYRPFEYAGPADASIVMVVLGHGAPVVQQAVAHMNRTSHSAHKIGVLTVRVYRPWSVAHFLEALPRSALVLSVSECTRPAAASRAGAAAAAVEQHSALFADVAASFHTGLWRGTKPMLVNNSIGGDHGGVTLAAVRGALAALTDAHDLSLESESAAVQLSVWGARGETARLVAASARALRDQGFATRSQTSEDTLGGACDATRVRLVVSKTREALLLERADAVVCHDAEVFVHYRRDILAELKPGGQLVLCFDPSRLADRSVLPGGVRVTVIDVHAVATAAAAALRLDVHAVALATFHLATVTAANRFFPYMVGPDGVDVRHLRGVAPAFDALAPEVADGFIAQVQGSLLDLVPAAAVDDAAPKAGAAAAAAAAQPQFRPRVRLAAAPAGSAAAAPAAAPAAAAPAPAHEVCWRLMFPEAYASESGLRPGTEGIFRVRLTKNKRLTPMDYDRNVFHLEMDTTGTGLRYEIGDALGVYAHNDSAEVDEFLAFYGLDRHAFVSLESASGGQREVMTVEKLLEQRLDLFGKPPKKFYAALAGFALDSYEQKRLKWLGSEDKEGFRLRQLETVTYADVLREFPSARPPLSALVELIPPIKPRHYSISSSMKMCPNSVHLLVVAVEWTTPKGRKRFGQCTRYLAGLRPEHYEVYITVDIKPSVMRLPADPRAPVIMSGLGTGMAPFRAFLQERAFLRAQGVAVGPMTLYFGARYRASEYLYGEELDRWHAEGLLTHLRLAFSRDRDGPKVYIQDKIKEDKARLYQELHLQPGAFYLCGPTWPVPDVRNALTASLVESGGMTHAQADDTIELWKDTGRYILEVY